jgi:type I restriction enzyme M protein
MLDEHIDKVLELYKDRKTVDKVAYLASYDDIEKNGFNLNIPRYVDTSEKEADIDLKQVATELKETNKKIREGNEALLSMLSELTFDSDETKEAVEEFMKILEEN